MRLFFERDRLGVGVGVGVVEELTFDVKSMTVAGVSIKDDDGDDTQGSLNEGFLSFYVLPSSLVFTRDSKYIQFKDAFIFTSSNNNAVVSNEESMIQQEIFKGINCSNNVIVRVIKVCLDVIEDVRQSKVRNIFQDIINHQTECSS